MKLKENEKRDKYLDLARELKKRHGDMKRTMIPIGAHRTIPKGFVKETGRFSHQRTSGDHPNYGIVKIALNTKKSPSVLSLKLSVSTSVKNFNNNNNNNVNSRRRKWTRRHEFKSWTRLIAFHITLIPLGKV